MNRVIVFVPKPDTVAAFRCETQQQLRTWRPEICGVCCLKMVGDTEHKTKHVSLWQLTQDCCRRGAFIEKANGEIKGIFYKPLLKVAADYGLHGKIHRWLPLMQLKHLLRVGQIPVISIELSRVHKEYHGGHLLVVVSYDASTNIFTVHDPSSVLAQPGEAVLLRASELKRLSNNRGFSFA
jgi:hypothetical protein